MPLIASAPEAWAATPITGGGSGFAALEISQWQADVASPANGSLHVNYSSQSSGIGRQYFATNTWDFAASDIRYINGFENAYLNQMQSGRCGGRLAAQCFQYVPVSAGGLGFMYNLTNADGSRMTNLRLTPSDVCGLFTGRITSWNQLSSNNPSLRNSSQAITPVVRQDEAGESYVLSQFCIAQDPSDWSAFAHFQLTNPCAATQEYASQDVQAFTSGLPIPTWPSVLLNCHNIPVANGSDGVANTVADPTQGPGSITYNAAAYALVRSFPNAFVQNAAGSFTEPNSLSVTIALEFASPVGDGTFTLDFSERRGADPRAYNPSTYSYVLAQTGGFDTGRGTTLADFLCYAIGKGQQRAAALLYAPLSAQVQAIGEAAILKVPGAPPSAACLAGAPPPPPPPTLILVHPTATTVAGSPASGGSLPGATSGSRATGGAKSRSSAATGHNAVAQASNPLATSGSGGSGPGQSASGQQLTSAASLPPHSTTNYDAAWSVLEGAGICAIGVAFAGQRRRSRE
jgi:phosphate transport system substrate-binding protein